MSTDPGRYGHLDEKALIALCKEKNRGAFNELILRYERKVYNFAYRLTGNHDDAGDIAADAFVRIYNSLSNFRGDSAFVTWLYRVVTNIYLDSRKRSKAHLTHSLDEMIDLEETSVSRQIEDPGPDPSEIAELKERGELLQAAIATLPEYQRSMIVLYHNENRSYEEIAEMMDLPIGTVKSRLNRARWSLREKLEPIREHFQR
jgi:RNA polymerase sigma-70 factor (ECF subfamily)